VAVLVVLAGAWALAALVALELSRSFIDDGGCYPASPGYGRAEAIVACLGIAAIVVAADTTVRVARRRARWARVVVAHGVVVALVATWIALLVFHEEPPSISFITDEDECARVH
jgi:uncharacterized PurR-regulated membrane protein YhhQ (DUF165 family)